MRRHSLSLYQHEGGDIFSELLGLLADVEEEGIRAPSANQHDCVDRDIGKVHVHGAGTSVAVGTYFIFGETQGVAPDGLDYHFDGASHLY
eukprot:14874927-Ditylum_brightwellii.AAC.1